MCLKLKIFSRIFEIFYLNKKKYFCDPRSWLRKKRKNKKSKSLKGWGRLKEEKKKSKALSQVFEESNGQSSKVELIC